MSSRRSYIRVPRQTESLTQATAALPSRATFSVIRWPGNSFSGDRAAPFPDCCPAATRRGPRRGAAPTSTSRRNPRSSWRRRRTRSPPGRWAAQRSGPTRAPRRQLAEGPGRRGGGPPAHRPAPTVRILRSRTTDAGPNDFDFPRRCQRQGRPGGRPFRRPPAARPIVVAVVAVILRAEGPPEAAACRRLRSWRRKPPSRKSSRAKSRRVLRGHVARVAQPGFLA